MALRDYLTIENGIKVLKRATVAFTGTANEIIATDNTGKLSSTLLPNGVEVAQITATATESIAAGDWVHFYDDGGIIKVVKAVASDITKVCNGFCLNAISISNTGIVSIEGKNTGVTVSAALVGEPYFLTDTPGVGSTTANAITNGYVNQVLGIVVGANSVRFEPSNYEFVNLT